MATTEPTLLPCPDCKRTDGTHDQFRDCWTAAYLRRPAASHVPMDGGGENRTEFLWPHEDGTVEQAAYEFANGKTEGYRRDWYHVMLGRIRVRLSSTGAQAEADWRDLLTDEEKGVMLATEHGNGDGTIYAIRANILHDALIRVAKLVASPVPARPEVEEVLAKMSLYSPDGNGKWYITDEPGPLVPLSHVRMALAALRSPSAGEWEPMETAPRDGTEVLFDFGSRCEAMRFLDQGIIGRAWYGFSATTHEAMLSFNPKWTRIPPTSSTTETNDADRN